MNVGPNLLIFLAYISFTRTAKILGVFSIPGVSRFICNNAILRSLANAGHEITVLTAYPNESAKENYTSVINPFAGEFMSVGQSAVEDYSKLTFLDFLLSATKLHYSVCEKVINMKEIQEILKSKEKIFDVMFVEVILNDQCFNWIAKKLNIPIIGVLTMRSGVAGDLQISNSRHPVFVPIEMGKTANHKNFFDRLQNVLLYLTTLGVGQILSLYSRYINTNDDSVSYFQKYATDHNSFTDFMTTKPSLIFVNGHSSYFPRPMNPNMIEIGGITLTETESLPEDVQLFLDGAKQGAILFCFGSVIRIAKVPENKIRAFVKAFAEIPQRVIWKYEEPIEGLSDNVMMMKWLPQKDILAHKNVKAFISHCGQGAIHESIHHGVPLISCPLFADQYLNANIFEKLQIAVHLNYQTITKECVLKALNEVINNTQYYENMQKLSNVFKDRPMTPQQTVVYWTEYVIRHNGFPSAPTTELNWFQFLLLDVLSFVIFAAFAILYCIYFIYKMSYSFIRLHCEKNVKNKCD